MVDLSNARRAPIGDLSPAPVAGVALAAAPAAARFLLRGGEAVEPAGKAFGVAVPVAPCRANAVGVRAALWLGPDEWLLIAEETDPEAIQSSLRTALAGSAHSLVDISHRQAGLILRGAHAAQLLNCGVPLDLSPQAFPVGAVARTIFDKAEIVLWRNDADSFRLEVWRSFAPYVCSLLEAAREDIAF